MRVVLLSMLIVSTACVTSTTPADAGAPDAGTLTDAGVTVDAGTTDAGVAGLAFFSKLAGLWAGPATMTPLGDFPIMAVDFRGVGDGFLFGQTDLDAMNTLRFGFSIETYAGTDVLSYRNGGFFQGVLRDTRTTLIERDDAAGRYRFCSVDRGCTYLDARFTFATADQLTFDVKVRGNQHVWWSARRAEPRTLPMPYPATLTSRGDGSAPWPTMGALSLTVRWPAPLTADADVWALLTTTPCFPTFQCNASRSVKVRVAAGATSAVVRIPTVHAGTYKVTTVVDRDVNFFTTRAPSRGDSVGIDADLTMTPQDTSLEVQALYTAP
ncbi:MAG: hypothetical protein Q8L14_27055 [Myxococcales bacterium]|nr:hypothetical protein [Myxococcales bacterium]